VSSRILIAALPIAVIALFWALAVAEGRRYPSAARSGFVRRNGIPLAIFLIVCVGLWSIVMIVLPQLYMVDFSFRPRLPPSQIGGAKDIHTLENYRFLLFGRQLEGETFNSVHLKAFGVSIWISALITLFNFLLCYPLAYFMAQGARENLVRVLALALIVPFWVNELLRAFAFRLLFASGGMINSLLLFLGLIDQPVDFLAADIAMYAGLSYAYLLMMLFPLYNAIEALDRHQIEAARDLGAPWWHIHLFVVMPFAKPGIASGCTMVFMLCAGALAAPLLLGGPSSLWFTQIVYNWFFQAFNWNLGAAYAFALLAACIAIVMLALRAARVSLGEIVR
jgi:spermidine/putrescine transport system permease protein